MANPAMHRDARTRTVVKSESLTGAHARARRGVPLKRWCTWSYQLSARRIDELARRAPCDRRPRLFVTFAGATYVFVARISSNLAAHASHAAYPLPVLCAREPNVADAATARQRAPRYRRPARCAASCDGDPALLRDGRPPRESWTRRHDRSRGHGRTVGTGRRRSGLRLRTLRHRSPRSGDLHHDVGPKLALRERPVRH